MNRTLLKQLASEVSVKTLGGMIVSYAENAACEDVTEDVLESIAAIEMLIAELKSRGSGAKPERKRDNRRKPTGGDADGSVREESGELQRPQHASTGTIRVGNGAVSEQL